MGGKNIGLIEINVCYCFSVGFVMVLEGIFFLWYYGLMLEWLYVDFGGYWFYFDLLFEEMVCCYVMWL